ncbi:hypothetical protein BD769DRAFT_1639787 [Suillus cothurnatus]|nr:hypothetical protein BD769DRAFT_1639787 [Suillus cothurnatus]
MSHRTMHFSIVFAIITALTAAVSISACPYPIHCESTADCCFYQTCKSIYIPSSIKPEWQVAIRRGKKNSMDDVDLNTKYADEVSMAYYQSCCKFEHQKPLLNVFRCLADGLKEEPQGSGFLVLLAVDDYHRSGPCSTPKENNSSWQMIVHGKHYPSRWHQRRLATAPLHFGFSSKVGSHARQSVNPCSCWLFEVCQHANSVTSNRHMTMLCALALAARPSLKKSVVDGDAIEPKRKWLMQMLQYKVVRCFKRLIEILLLDKVPSRLSNRELGVGIR